MARFTVSVSALKSALAQVMGCASTSRKAKPILSTVLIYPLRDSVRVECTDWEKWAQAEVYSTEIAGYSRFRIDAKQLAAFIRNCPASADVTLYHTEGENTASAVCGEMRGSFETQPDTIGEMPANNGELLCTIPANDLAQAVRVGIPATDNKSGRFALGGLCFAGCNGEALSIVSTDGRRLHLTTFEEYQTKETPTASAQDGHILPTASAQALLKFLKPFDKGRDSVAVYVYVTLNTVRFQVEQDSFHSRQIEGRFPRWRDVIPATSGAIRKIASTADLCRAFSAVTASAAIYREDATLDDKQVSLIKVDCTLNGSASLNRAANRASCNLTGSPDEVLTVSLDPLFVTDFLSALPKGETETTIHGIDGYSPLLLEAGRFKAVVMPMPLK